MATLIPKIDSDSLELIESVKSAINGTLAVIKSNKLKATDGITAAAYSEQLKGFEFLSTIVATLGKFEDPAPVEDLRKRYKFHKIISNVQKEK